MSALFQFDKMLLTVEQDANKKSNARRQVEVFSHDGKLYLRIGAVDSENDGIGRYTVQLSGQDARELIDGIESGVSYLQL